MKRRIFALCALLALTLGAVTPGAVPQQAPTVPVAASSTPNHTCDPDCIWI